MKELIKSVGRGLLSIITGTGRVIGITFAGVLILALLHVPPFEALIPILSRLFNRDDLF